MSLKTLLFSILSIMMVLLWGTTFYAVLQNEKNEIQTELYNNSKNVAQSLSLTLSNANGDITLMKTMINAVFDGGHFSKIVLKDTENKTIYKRIKEINEYKVPQWFKKFIKLSSPVANANVSNGWTPIGILYVQNDIEYAYDKMYRIFISLLIIYVVATIISILILRIVLHLILKPLEKIKQQANEIIQNKFVIIKKLPFIKELREVTIALNKMVMKLKTMFENANKEITRLKEKEYIDPITNLKNRKYFIEKLNSILNSEDRDIDGINIFIMLKNLDEANKKLGRIKTDNLLKEIAKIVEQFLQQKSNNFIFARLNGSEFVIFIPHITKENAQNLINDLKNLIQRIVNKYTNIIEVIIGAYIVKNSTNLEEILSNTDKAVAIAEVNQDHIAIIENTSHTLYSKEEWKNILKEAIKNKNFEFLEYKAVNFVEKKLHHITLSLCLVLNNKKLRYSEFIPAAIHLDLIDEIYKIALQKLVSLKLENKKYSFKLPQDFIIKTNNFLYLEKLLEKNKLNYELILEIPEKYIIEDISTAKELVKILNKNNIKTGIYNFIAESNNLDYLIDLSPMFIKSDKNFFLNQSKEALIHLKNIAIATETDLIATGVNEDKYLETLKRRDIKIIQGKVAEKIIGD